MSILQYFKSETIVVQLYSSSAGSYSTEGKWVPGAKIGRPVTILKPQPAPGEFLKTLEEGEYTGDFLLSAVDSSADIKTRRDSFEPDEVEFRGDRYEVFSVERWGDYGGADKMILKRGRS